MIEILHFIHIWVNLHFQNNEKDGENKLKNHMGQHKWNKVDETVNNHLHQEAIILKNSYEKE